MKKNVEKTIIILAKHTKHSKVTIINIQKHTPLLRSSFLASSLPFLSISKNIAFPALSKLLYNDASLGLNFGSAFGSAISSSILITEIRVLVVSKLG